MLKSKPLQEHCGVLFGTTLCICTNSYAVIQQSHYQVYTYGGTSDIFLIPILCLLYGNVIPMWLDRIKASFLTTADRGGYIFFSDEMLVESYFNIFQETSLIDECFAS